MPTQKKPFQPGGLFEHSIGAVSTQPPSATPHHRRFIMSVLETGRRLEFGDRVQGQLEPRRNGLLSVPLFVLPIPYGK